MTKLVCPIEGHENFVVELPDVFLVRHHEQYTRGISQAREKGLIDEKSSINLIRFYGSQALCTKFENAPAGEIDDWPLAVYMWFLDAVYYDRFDKALSPPKK